MDLENCDKLPQSHRWMQSDYQVLLEIIIIIVIHEALMTYDLAV